MNEKVCYIFNKDQTTAMNDYLFSGESVIETGSANFLISLSEHSLPQFGLFGLDSEMRLLSLPEKHESIGGKLYLTNFRLFFQSHQLNRFKGTFSIFLQNITKTGTVSQDFSKVLGVSTPNHKHLFIVRKIPKLISAIAAAQNLLSPVQTETLRIFANNFPEKCGDGMKVSPPVMDVL